MKEYIERAKLMEFPIRIDHYDKENGNEHFVYGIEAVLEYAEAIPAADVVERKRGEWVKVDYWKIRNGQYIHFTAKRCSVCGADSPCKSEYKFCPNCGADMRGEKHEAD